MFNAVLEGNDRGVTATLEQAPCMAACGSLHTFAVTEAGDLWAWGAGDDAQLGLGLRLPQCLPAPVNRQALGGAGVVVVSAGCQHSAACTADGTLWTWGDGANGRLGHGHTKAQVFPTPLPVEAFGGSLVQMVACGAEHVLAIADGGALWAFGCGHDGQLGLGDADDRFVPTRCDLGGSASAAFVAAGEDNSVAVSRKGVVFSWGKGSWGKLGHGDCNARLFPTEIDHDFDEEVVTVACGRDHTAAVTIGGCLFAWGRGTGFGQLGLGNCNDTAVPMLVGSDETFGSGVLTIACGSFHTLAVTQAGALFAWGLGEKGRLGHGDDSDKHVPTRVCFDGEITVTSVAAGDEHSVVVTADGKLYTFGMACLETDDSDSDDAAATTIRIPTGLGHGDMEHKLRPCLLDPEVFASALIGRCRRIPRAHALAFAMCTHERLGQECVFAGLLAELLQRIAVQAWPQARVALSEGMVRLLGGGDIS